MTQPPPQPGDPFQGQQPGNFGQPADQPSPPYGQPQQPPPYGQPGQPGPGQPGPGQQPYGQPGQPGGFPPPPQYGQPGMPPGGGMPPDAAAPYGYDPSGRPYSDKQKMIAGLLGILLGGFGVGRFYMGYTNIGILQIVVTVLTCGIGSLWGLIDGIMILVNGGTDAQGRPLRPS